MIPPIVSSFIAFLAFLVAGFWLKSVKEERRADRYKSWLIKFANARRCTLKCPKCERRHLDEGEWAIRPHRTHLCLGCGEEWTLPEFWFGT